MTYRVTDNHGEERGTGLTVEELCDEFDVDRDMFAQDLEALGPGAGLSIAPNLVAWDERPVPRDEPRPPDPIPPPNH